MKKEKRFINEVKDLAAKYHCRDFFDFIYQNYGKKRQEKYYTTTSQNKIKLFRLRKSYLITFAS